MWYSYCLLPWMYILRAYQSPYSIADWGPQCAQMPNLASLYQSGTCHSRSDSRVPLKGPDVTSSTDSEDWASALHEDTSAGDAAINENAVLLVICTASLLRV